MTVPNENFRSGPYTGNGATTSFAYDFIVHDENALAVFVTSIAGVASQAVLDTDYTVSGVGVTSGGSVTFITAPATGETVVISLAQPMTQESDYQTEGAFDMETVEVDFDRATLRSKTVLENQSRALTFPQSDGISASDLPSQSLRAGKYLSFDASGQPVTETILDPSEVAEFQNLSDIGATTYLEGEGPRSNGTNLVATKLPAADGANDFTGANSFLDDQLSIKNETDPTKILAFDVSGVSNDTTVTMTVPNVDFTAATEADLTTAEGRITTNETDITSLTSRVTAAEALVTTGVSYIDDTLADLNARAGTSDGEFAYVTSDGTASNNGIYERISGTWTKQADIPDFVSTKLDETEFDAFILHSDAKVSVRSHADERVIKVFGNKVFVPRLEYTLRKASPALTTTGNSDHTEFDIPALGTRRHIYINLSTGALESVDNNYPENNATSLYVAEIVDRQVTPTQGITVRDMGDQYSANRGKMPSRRMMFPMVAQSDKSEFNIPQIDTNKFQHIGGITNHDTVDLDAGGSCNIDGLPLGKHVTVTVRGNAGGSGTVFAGFGRKFTGEASGNTLTVAAGGSVTITNQGTNNNHSVFAKAPDDITASTETEPTPTKVVYFAGQSNAQRAYLYGAIPGMSYAMRDTNFISPVYDEIIQYVDVAKGGSCEDEAGEFNGAGHWWDRSLNGGTGGAGPELTSALSEMASLTPTDIIWDIGETATVGLDDGLFTTPNLITSITAIFEAFRAAHPSVNIHVNMIGSRDDGRYGEAGSAVKYAYLKVIASLSYVHKGVEKYDLARPYNDLHLATPGFQAYGARLARHLVNVWDSRTASTGPTLTSGVLSNSGKTLTIVITSTDTMIPLTGTKGGGFSDGPNPFGMHVFESSDPIGNTIDLIGGRVVSETGTVTTLEVWSEDDMTGANLLAAAGVMYDAPFGDYPQDDKDVGHFGARGFPMQCGLIETLST